MGRKMKNNTRIMLNMLLIVIAIIMIIIGVASGIYYFSIAGVLFFLAMLILRGRHIRKLNREIKEIKETDQDEIDDTEVK
jgi:4-hydroxybenzoate polyprenyltransferase